jgi:HAE1 family hydrophobic/amphiphilic exporter-1
VNRDPDVESLVATVGGPAAAVLGGPNIGQIVVHLKPRSERDDLVDGIIERLRPKLATLPGVRVYMQNPPVLRIGGQVTKSLYQFTLQSPDKEELYATTESLEKELAGIPALRDVTSDVQIKSPQVQVTIDRDKAAALQVNAQQVENTLYDAYGPRWVSTIYSSVSEYKVLLELLPEYQSDPRALAMLYFKAPSGRLIPLDALADISETIGPQAVSHSGQLPAATVSFDLSPGHSLGAALEEVRKTAERVVPPTMSTTFSGLAAAFEGSMTNLWVLLFIAIMVVYLVLGILYESYIHPLTILSGLPSAGFGALATLWLFGMELNIYGFVGLIMLIGIVKKNAIMQIDFALDAERSGMNPEEAIYQGCLIRFRPIMMTTMAALLGAVPIAIGYGAGGEARQSLGLCVVGGLLFSQAVTLFLTPVFYLYLGRVHTLARRRRTDRQAPELVPTGD